MPKLGEIFEGAFSALRMTGRAPSTIAQYQIAIRHWERATGNPDVATATDVQVASVASAIIASGDSAATANKTTRRLMSLLRFAASRGLCPAISSIGRIPEPKRVPRAWLLEVDAILAASRQEPGLVCSIRACLWWESLLLATYDCGGRIGAILATTRADLDFSAGTILLRPESQKTNEGQLLSLHRDTLAAIERTAPSLREVVWPWPWRREALYLHFRHIIGRAGVECGAGPNSLFHRLRRTNASYLKAAGGDPTLQLGHSSSQVTRRYLDPRICGQQRASEMIPRPKIA